MELKKIHFPKIESDNGYIADTFTELHQSAVERLYRTVSDEIKKRLLEIGLKFESEEEFLEYAKENLISVCHVDSPNIRNIYIKESQTLIGWFDDRIDMSWNKNTINLTMNYFHPATP